MQKISWNKTDNIHSEKQKWIFSYILPLRIVGEDKRNVLEVLTIHCFNGRATTLKTGEKLGLLLLRAPCPNHEVISLKFYIDPAQENGNLITHITVEWPTKPHKFSCPSPHFLLSLWCHFLPLENMKAREET